MLHALFLLAMMLFAAPLFAFIPMAALAGVLSVVAWNMFEKHAFTRLLSASRGDAVILLVTFLLTVFRDLTEAIIIGFALGSVLFIHRMSQMAEVDLGVRPDRADDTGPDRRPYADRAEQPDHVLIYRVSGAFFFGAAAAIESVLTRIGDQHRTLIIDFSAVPLIDSTGAHTIESLIDVAERRKISVVLTGLGASTRAALAAMNAGPPRVREAPDIASALDASKLAQTTTTPGSGGSA
jgi:SulP family sulfate permease